MIRQLRSKTTWLGVLEMGGGFLILWGFLLAGIQLKAALHLILPGNVLGLFLLLGAMATGIVKLRYIELASKWLLFFMPLLFVPIYVEAGADKALWVHWGWLLVPSLIVAVSIMWVFIGHLAQWIMRHQPASPSHL